MRLGPVGANDDVPGGRQHAGFGNRNRQTDNVGMRRANAGVVAPSPSTISVIRRFGGMARNCAANRKASQRPVGC